MTGGNARPLVRVAGVRFRYRAGVPAALEGVDLEIGPGEVVALMGPNGAGKSTLLRVLLGDLHAAAGALELPARRGADGRLAVGYAPDEGAHLEALSGIHNAVFFARAAGLDRRDAHAAVREHLDRLGLAADAHRRVSELSFGQRRKLLLVEAAAHAPALLLLDEPTAGLDAEAHGALARLLRVRASEGRAALMASHDLAFIAEVADRVVFMRGGRVAGGGRPVELVAGLGETTRLEFALGAPPAHEVTLPEGVRLVADGGPWVVESASGQALLPDVTAALIAAGARVRSVAVREPGLAEAFRRATGEELGP